MYKILKITAFGFVIEFENDSCFFNNACYEIYINDLLALKSNKNVVSISDLKPNTNYIVKIKGFEKEVSFEIQTEKVNYLINVRDYNAFGDGLNNDTSAINSAIYSAPKNSTVYFSKGVYLVDQIFLLSNIDLYFEKGSVLKQNINRKQLSILKGYQKNYDYTDVTVNSSWEGSPLDCYCSLIFGKNIENVNIYGDGTIDGSGEEGKWWNDSKNKNIAYRPRNIFLNNCTNINIIGLTSQNSAAWNVHPFYCTDINFYCLTIKSSPDSPNTDGLNPESCENVNIIGCYFSVGDDCIAIKSGKYFMSVKHFKRTRNVFISNCYMEKGHGALVIGSEMSCGASNVTVTKCFFKGTDRGLRIKTRRGRGSKAILDSIKFDNVQMEDVKHCFVINMYYYCDPDGMSDYVRNKDVEIKDDFTPTISNIFVEKIHATNIIGSAIFIYGLPESKVSNINISDSVFEFSDKRINEVPAMMEDFDIIENLGILIKFGENITFSNNSFKGEYVNII